MDECRPDFDEGDWKWNGMVAARALDAVVAQINASTEMLDQQIARLEAQANRLQQQLARIRPTQDPQERERLLHEEWGSMQSAMQPIQCQSGSGTLGSGRWR